MSKNTCGVMNPLGGKVSGAGFFRSGKIAQGNHFPINLDSGSPFSAICIDPHEPRLAPSLVSVLNISSSADNSKVVDAVVTPNAVDVVNFTIGPDAVNVQPCNSAQAVTDVINFCSDISVAVIASSNVANVNGIDRALAPRKNPGFWVVVEKFAQTFCGKIGLSHDAVLSLIGQRPRGVSALSGLCHFNTRGA
jgi:hypothetical protein